MPEFEGSGPRIKEGGSGIPPWLLIGGAIAGVLGLVVLLGHNQQTGSTAAGTSINAALGSLQEQVQGMIGGEGALSQEIQQSAINAYGNTANIAQREEAMRALEYALWNQQAGNTAEAGRYQQLAEQLWQGTGIGQYPIFSLDNSIFHYRTATTGSY